MSPSNYDVVWSDGNLRLRFTPNERDEPVICEVPPDASAAVRASGATVGDVLEAFELHAPGQRRPMARVQSFRQLMSVLATADLPVTLRFRSRQHESPQPLPARAIDLMYSFEWTSTTPLGLSFAMDPCTLHTTITRADPSRISPELAKLEPKVGDILVCIKSADGLCRADETWFDQVIDVLKASPRPCMLKFARLNPPEPAAPMSNPLPELGRLNINSTAPYSEPVRSRGHSVPLTAAGTVAPRRKPLPDLSRPWVNPTPPMSEPSRSRGHSGPQPPAGPVPMPLRQSFCLEEQPAQQRDGKGGKRPKERLYKVMYSGGPGGIQLSERSQHAAPSDYAMVVRKVLDARMCPGLERAVAGDELVAIDHQDLRHVPYATICQMLSRINTPTALIFRGPKRHVSAMAGVGDALFLCLI